MSLYHDKVSLSTKNIKEQRTLFPEQLCLFDASPVSPLFSDNCEVKCSQQLTIKAPPVALTTDEADQPNAIAHVEANTTSLCSNPFREIKRCTVETRQIKGLRIAASSHIERDGELWVIPSQSSSKKYIVRYKRREQTCTCPDFESRRQPCKHIHAVCALLRPQPTVGIPPPPRKATYRQEWREYNLAQTNEKAKLQELLYELCRGIEDIPRKPGAGRTRLHLREMIFCVVFKVYSTISGRRFISDLREAQKRGYISRTPHFNSIFNYLELEGMTECLASLISQSSLPLKAVEEDFAVDSSGFSTGIATRWVKTKYADESEEASMMGWLKAHIMCGVKTNIVTSCEISERYSSDILYFKPLVEATSQNFKMREVSADKAYLSAKALRQVVSKGAEPYIPFKINTNAHHYNDKSGVWYRLWHYYNFNNEEFTQQYHKRSNVEATFSMIKAKFGERLRSKTETAQQNELLCKILCHNLCCVIQSMYELGIDPAFKRGYVH